jgi:hypothetical protein
MWVNNNTTLPNMTQITIFITIVLPTLFHLKIRIIDDYSGIVVNNGDLTKNNSFFLFLFFKSMFDVDNLSYILTTAVLVFMAGPR